MPSGRFLDYFQQGDIADRPATPDIATNAIALYWAQDEDKLYLYSTDDADVTAWRVVPLRFAELLDGVADYTGLAGQFLVVKMDETGLETLAVTIPTDEHIQDMLSSFLVAGSARITLTYDDAGNTLTFDVPVEPIQDMIGSFIVAGSARVTVTYDDAGNSLAIDVPVEAIQDIIGALIAAGAGIVVTYDDAGNAESIAVDFASAADINTGTSVTKVINPDKLAASNFGRRVVQIPVTDPAGTALATGDGQAYFVVPPEFNGMNLVDAQAAVVGAVSSSGLPTIQIANVTDTVDMLSTKITIDASEFTSYSAATASVVDGTHDDVATGDILRVDVDVAGTGAKGLVVILTFMLP